jgi:hypothetical protein
MMTADNGKFDALNADSTQVLMVSSLSLLQSWLLGCTGRLLCTAFD